eukprot:CAMPEP_0175752602 /NCGR_PEP_ID=MMETSP0097-20121207/61855_1 /TAXON_ID=311494 /ORGANISM="Alexandrium monilatum, Strain CCMP3105" /LENGTH=91 /DNA_ID=CAMNT_0017061403 /DNA_START=296 /DNA_END=568 /DNA_ORIENTATION=+
MLNKNLLIRHNGQESADILRSLEGIHDAQPYTRTKWLWGGRRVHEDCLRAVTLLFGLSHKRAVGPAALLAIRPNDAHALTMEEAQAGFCVR